MNALEETPITGSPRRAAEQMVHALFDGIAASNRRDVRP